MKKYCIILLLLFSFFMINPQEKLKLNEDTKEIVLDPETAVSLALANNLGIKSEILKFNSKKWSMFTSFNIFYPTVSMSAAMSKTNLNEDERTVTAFVPSLGPMGLILEEEETTRPEWSLIANFNLSLSLNAYMGFKVYQTVLDWKQGKINLEIARKQIARDVKKNMNILIINKKEIEILEEELENARKRYNQAVINYKNGLVSEYDMLSIEVSYEQKKQEILNVKIQYFKQLLYFKQMIGLKKDIEIMFNSDVVSDKIVLSKDEVMDKFLNNNLDLKVQLNTIEGFKNARNIAISFLTPTFSIGYSMDPAFQEDSIEEKWFGDKEYMDDNWKQNNGAFTLSLSVPLSSLIPFSREYVDIINSQYNIEVAKLFLEDLKNGIEINMEMIFAELSKSVESIEILKLNIKKAERAFQKAEEGFYTGIKNRLEVDESESALKKAKVDLLQEELNYTNNLLELEYIINSKL